MTPDEFKEAWQMQPAPSLHLNADALLTDVRRKQQEFSTMIVARDLLEIGVAIALVPIWLAMGYGLKLPWTWYLTIPALVWIGGFMWVDRKRQRRYQSEAGMPLRESVERSLAQVEHQVWLLRNIFWWYLLPPAVPMLAFFAQVAWKSSQGIGEAIAVMATFSSIVSVVYAAIYWLNQRAVRVQLLPRCQELKELLEKLKDEPATE